MLPQKSPPPAATLPGSWISSAPPGRLVQRQRRRPLCGPWRPSPGEGRRERNESERVRRDQQKLVVQVIWQVVQVLRLLNSQAGRQVKLAQP